jgi:hypothetical protein
VLGPVVAPAVVVLVVGAVASEPAHPTVGDGDAVTHVELAAAALGASWEQAVCAQVGAAVDLTKGRVKGVGVGAQFD